MGTIELRLAQGERVWFEIGRPALALELLPFFFGDGALSLRDLDVRRRGCDLGA